MNYGIEARRRRYFQLSSQIAQMESDALQCPPDADKGWGRNHLLNLGRTKVFVKRVPITTRERENLLSTRNLYNLPTYYNYGVGSAGSGVFRELVTHIKTTNWVLNGDIESFPLMYHYRIIPFPGEKPPVDLERHQKYVEYWGGSENIGEYILDRANADHELVLFLEYIPLVLHPWLKERPQRTRAVIDELFETIAFLRKNGVIHFDAHFHNILTDGNRLYLTDFGLVLDNGFSLTKEEQRFWSANNVYDYGCVISCIISHFESRYEALPETDRKALALKYGAQQDAGSRAVTRLMLKDEQGLRRGPLKLDPSYAECLIEFRDALELMYQFYGDLVANPKKDTKFPQEKLRRRLAQTSRI